MHVVIGKISVLQCIAWIHGKNKKQRTPPSNPRAGQEANMTVITKRAVVLIGKKVFLQKSATHTKLTKKKESIGMGNKIVGEAAKLNHLPLYAQVFNKVPIP